MENTLSPFEVHDNSLYVLSTGKAVSEVVKDDLLHIKHKSSQWHNEEKNERFELPLKRRKIRSFADDAHKVELSTKEMQLKEAKCTRDMIERLLYLAISQKLDIGTVLSYPLTPVPLSYNRGYE